jgi:hypothetical protein
MKQNMDFLSLFCIFVVLLGLLYLLLVLEEHQMFQRPALILNFTKHLVFQKLLEAGLSSPVLLRKGQGHLLHHFQPGKPLKETLVPWKTTLSGMIFGAIVPFPLCVFYLYSFFLMDLYFCCVFSETLAKAKRLARFKVELSKSEHNNDDDVADHTASVSEKKHMDSAANVTNGHGVSDNEGRETSNVIIGLCPDMCPGIYLRFKI